MLYILKWSDANKLVNQWTKLVWKCRHLNIFFYFISPRIICVNYRKYETKNIEIEDDEEWEKDEKDDNFVILYTSISFTTPTCQLVW